MTDSITFTVDPYLAVEPLVDAILTAVNLSEFKKVSRLGGENPPALCHQDAGVSSYNKYVGSSFIAELADGVTRAQAEEALSKISGVSGFEEPFGPAP
jgi:hypothetical protein